jgi:hypothetical protein
MAEEIASIGIDPTPAEAGAKRVDAAFKQIENAANRLAKKSPSQDSYLQV